MKKLGFGLMRLPLLMEGDPQSIDTDQVTKMADYYMSKGFNYFDTAYPYHQGASEKTVRKTVVERYPRESFFLADKMPVWLVKSQEDHRRFFDEQLTRCGVEYFDYYLLHNLGEANYAASLKHGSFDFIKDVKARGLAKNIGFSFHDKASLLDAILKEHPEMEFVQLQLNYIDWENESIESRKCYEVAVKHNKPVIVMEPVKGGSLAEVPPEVEELFRGVHPDMSAASWAIRFAASHGNVFMVLSGMGDLRQMADNISFMEDFQPLDKKEMAVIDEAREMLARSNAIPCTACRYCVDDCPKHIPIPQYFSLYNNQQTFGFLPPHAAYYTNLAEKYGKASDCIACKKCEQHCPQHIAISGLMEKVAGVFE